VNGDIAPSVERDVEHFNRWSATYDRSILQQIFFVRIHRRMLDLLGREAAQVSPPESFIDVGCGTGRLLKAAAGKWPEARLHGADPAEGMISEANRLHPDLDVRLASAERLPFPDRSADIVVTSLSFHHWTDQAKGIGEIARVLKPGGHFCLADHTFLPARRLSGERPRSRAEVRELMAAAGLTTVRQQWAGLPFILISLARK